jgi:hypothetical protein
MHHFITIIAILILTTTVFAGDKSPPVLTCERCSPVNSKICGMLDNKPVLRKCADTHCCG